MCQPVRNGANELDASGGGGGGGVGGGRECW